MRPSVAETQATEMSKEETDLATWKELAKGEDGRLKLLLEKAHLESERAKQEEVHRRQMSELRKEMLMKETWMQNVHIRGKQA